MPWVPVMFYWLANKHRGCKQDRFEPDMLSLAHQCVSVCVAVMSVSLMKMMSLAPSSPPLSISSNPTLAYHPGISRSLWLWKAFYTSTFVNKVFSGWGATDRLWCSSSVWAEWTNSDQGRREGGTGQQRSGQGKEKGWWDTDETEPGEARRDRWRGWRNWQSSHWQQWGLLTIQEYCLKSICHLGAVEPVITMRYSPFHSDNLFSAFPVHLTPQLYKGHCPLSISVCQSGCLCLC